MISSEERKMAASGVKKSQQNILRHHHYVETLRNSSVKYVKQKTIRAFNHELYTIEQKKIGLSPFDLKRKVLSNGIDTIPYGFSLDA